jgi:hypothetical protein
VPLTHCPHCGDALASEADEILEQMLIEAAPVCPHVIREAARLEASQVGFTRLAHAILPISGKPEIGGHLILRDASLRDAPQDRGGARARDLPATYAASIPSAFM